MFTVKLVSLIDSFVPREVSLVSKFYRETPWLQALRVYMESP